MLSLKKYNAWKYQTTRGYSSKSSYQTCSYQTTKTSKLKTWARKEAAIIIDQIIKEQITSSNNNIAKTKWKNAVWYCGRLCDSHAQMAIHEEISMEEQLPQPQMEQQ